MAVAETRNIVRPLMNLVRLRGVPILRQLHLEEQLLRRSSDNWCIINDGEHDPTIVMGISGKPAELLELEPVIRDQIPVLRRFTGGGTVIVDSGTIFVTFICNKDTVPNLQPYPGPIMSWSSLIYNEVFKGVGDFSLRENDYVFGNRKFGGNAQSITKNRWIHHTSFLWDYEVGNMAYLKHPKKTPEYRLMRDHLEFICRMKDYLPRSTFIDETIKATGSHFSVRPLEFNTIESLTNPKFEPTTKLVTNDELKVLAFNSQLEVIGGTMNENGRVLVNATHVGSETALSQIVQLVEATQLARVPVQKLAEWMPKFFVPTVVAAFTTWLAGSFQEKQVLTQKSWTPKAMDAFELAHQLVFLFSGGCISHVI